MMKIYNDVLGNYIESMITFCPQPYMATVHCLFRCPGSVNILYWRIKPKFTSSYSSPGPFQRIAADEHVMNPSPFALVQM